ncbi:MAG TPA: glutamate-1-semialdehyde 2,1-aminomutase [Solirubrobacterales bacterium]|nr:glutamate-1-semialdehyde 2,1-aminomutase [Solirubrobacterales bacterium]
MSTNTTTRSAELYQRAIEVLPGGVNSPVRAMRQIGRDPIFIREGRGCELTDVDGNSYIDYVCSWGPMILGHADPDVTTAVTEAAARGTSYGAPVQAEVELAEELVARVPGAEMVRMTSSGTEAAMSAVRLARAATGRDKIIKFAGAYHGHSDGLLADAGSGIATLAVPGSPGVTQAQSNDTIVVPWNNQPAIEAALTKYGVAAIIAEPCPANMGLVPPKPGYLEFLREQATEKGALLIFDEVISGFRVARGGYQEKTGVTPDLTVLGKIVGGGLPAAAYAGSRELMEKIAPAGDVYQAGTLSGNPLAMAAGLATLRKLDAAAYATLAVRTEQLATGLANAAERAGVPVTVVQDCGLLTVFFSAAAPANYDAARNCDLKSHAAWCRALIDRGVYAPPSQFEAWFPSLAHDEDTIQRTLEVASAAFEEVASTIGATA